MNCAYNTGIQCRYCGFNSRCEIYKENAELREKLNKIERKCKFNFVDLLHDVENESKQEEQLTKAKEIIKKLSDAYKYVIQFEEYADREIVKDAEQFISEVEK